MRRIYVAFSLLLLTLFSCQREVSFIGGPDTPTFVGETPSPAPITAALQGNVYDENGAPAAGVAIQVGSKTATTNAKGYFRINDAPLDQKSALVTAAKAGYFKAYRTFAATSGANNVTIKLVKRTLAGNIDAAAGGEASLANGSKVALPAAGVVVASTNAAYTGQVKVYAAYIDPSAADIDQTIPGSFMANDKNGKRVTLSSYGMLAVELEGASGEKLQIKSGSAATLTTAIPSSVQGSAPQSIALWSVDETTGVWKEEGTATKSGSVYTGQVSHFSFWNCDVSANAIILSMTLKNTDGAPLVHAHVTIKRAAQNWVVHGYTDSLGQVSGYVPYNEALVMEVLDPCGTSFYTQAIGPFTQATNLGVITLTSPGNSILTVKGKLTNCSGTAVSNGFALVTLGYTTHYAAVNATGDFQTNFIRCSSSPATVDVIGVDNSTQQQSTASSTVTVVTPLTNAGTISACGVSTTQFINYTLDGTNYAITSANASDSLTAYTVDSTLGTTQKTTYMSGFQMTGSNKINFSFRQQTPVPGTYALVTLGVQNYQGNNGVNSVTILSPTNAVVTTFAAAAGQFYEGTFSGTFRDGNNVTHTLSGSFKLRRVF